MRCCWLLLMTILRASGLACPCPPLGLTGSSLEQPSALLCYDGDFHLFPVATDVSQMDGDASPTQQPSSAS